MENKCKTESVASVKELLQTRMDGMEKLTEERFKTSQLAINKAEEAQKLRNEASNEWRTAMKDRETIFATKIEMQRNTDDIKILQSFKDNFLGRQSVITVIVAFVVSLAMALLSKLF